MPRERKAPVRGLGVEILAAVYRHHHADGRQFSVQDAADMLGVAWPTLDDWIRDDIDLGKLRLKNARRLARFLGWTVDRLGSYYHDDRLTGILAPDAAITLPEVSAAVTETADAARAVRAALADHAFQEGKTPRPEPTPARRRRRG